MSNRLPIFTDFYKFPENCVYSLLKAYKIVKLNLRKFKLSEASICNFFATGVICIYGNGRWRFKFKDHLGTFATKWDLSIKYLSVLPFLQQKKETTRIVDFGVTISATLRTTTFPFLKAYNRNFNPSKISTRTFFIAVTNSLLVMPLHLTLPKIGAKSLKWISGNSSSQRRVRAVFLKRCRISGLPCSFLQQRRNCVCLFLKA